MRKDFYFFLVENLENREMLMEGAIRRRSSKKSKYKRSQEEWKGVGYRAKVENLTVIHLSVFLFLC